MTKTNLKRTNLHVQAQMIKGVMRDGATPAAVDKILFTVVREKNNPYLARLAGHPYSVLVHRTVAST